MTSSLRIMDSEEFKNFGNAAVNLIADYLDNIRERPVLPDVKPGFLHKLLPKAAPENGEHWTQIIADIEKLIIPGLTHWQSPMFNGFYPTGCSYPSIVGEFLSAGFGCLGFSWIASPAFTELEVISLDWLGKLLGLPEQFLNCSDGPGGGVIQGSASESNLIAILVAKKRALNKLKEEGEETTEEGKRFVAYSSDESNSSVEKAAKLSHTLLRLLPSDSNGRLRGEALNDAIEHDKEMGLIPFCVIATLGTTGTCAFDSLNEIGPICNRENIWLHVDAAYAGVAAICPEYKYIMEGIEYCDSFITNPVKWLLVNVECSPMWFKDSRNIVEMFRIERIYLKNVSAIEENQYAPNYMDWQVHLGRRFRSLKLWMTMRVYGVSGLQGHIRKQCFLAEHFEKLVRGDERFEVLMPASLGLVAFRIKGEDVLSKNLLKQLINDRVLFMVAANVKGKFALRYVIGSRLTEQSDVDTAWREILIRTNEILPKLENGSTFPDNVCTIGL